MEYYCFAYLSAIIALLNAHIPQQYDEIPQETWTTALMSDYCFVLSIILHSAPTQWCASPLPTTTASPMPSSQPASHVNSPAYSPILPFSLKLINICVGSLRRCALEFVFQSHTKFCSSKQSLFVTQRMPHLLVSASAKDPREERGGDTHVVNVVIMSRGSVDHVL